jgi:DNA-binding MarR family transcriptional regulator
MEYEALKLNNQLCFPVYALSRLITREYQPYLDKLGITYPQYLVLLILWENDAVSVNEIAHKLVLNTNTVTPLLKRMETMGLLNRKRSGNDERKVIISLTVKGKEMREQALIIPQSLASGLISSNISIDELLDLKQQLYKIIDYLKEKDGTIMDDIRTKSKELSEAVS